jgi:hypothetical protein
MPALHQFARPKPMTVRQSFSDFIRLTGKSVGSGTPKFLTISQQKAGKRNFTLK